jgi:hypothetical protein
MLAPAANSDLPTPLAGAGALRSSANDMLTFLEAFLGYKKSPLAPAMKAMLAVRRPAGQVAIGLGWIIMPAHGREIVGHNGATGGFRSLSNASTPGGVDDIGLHLLNPKAPLANPEPPKQRTEIRIVPRLLDNYTGRYQVNPNLILAITRDGDHLFAQAFVQLPHNRSGDPTAAPRFELFAEGEKNFFARLADQQITFETGPEGRATSLILHKAGRDMPAPRLSRLPPRFSLTGDDMYEIVSCHPGTFEKTARLPICRRRGSLAKSGAAFTNTCWDAPTATSSSGVIGNVADTALVSIRPAPGKVGTQI